MPIGIDTLEFTVPITEQLVGDLLPNPIWRNGLELGKICNYPVAIDVCRMVAHFSGSVQKAVDGQNVRCHYDAARLKIDELSDILHYDLYQAYAERSDIATTIEVEKPVSLILPRLSQLKGFERYPKEGVDEKYADSVYYNKYLDNRYVRKGQHTKSNVLVFYDKVAELKKRRETVPLFCSGANLIRIEYRTFYNSEKYYNPILPKLTIGRLLRKGKPSCETFAGINLLKLIKKMEMEKTLNLKADGIKTATAAAIRQIFFNAVGRLPSDSELKDAITAVRKSNNLSSTVIGDMRRHVRETFSDIEMEDLKADLLERVKAEKEDGEQFVPYTNQITEGF